MVSFSSILDNRRELWRDVNPCPALAQWRLAEQNGGLLQDISLQYDVGRSRLDQYLLQLLSWYVAFSIISGFFFFLGPYPPQSKHTNILGVRIKS